MFTQTEDGQIIQLPYNHGSYTEADADPDTAVADAGYYIIADDSVISMNEPSASSDYYVAKDNEISNSMAPFEDDGNAVIQEVVVDDQDYNVPITELEIECGDGHNEVENFEITTEVTKAIPVRELEKQPISSVLHEECLESTLENDPVEPHLEPVLETVCYNGNSVIQDYHPTISTLLSPPVGGPATVPSSPSVTVAQLVEDGIIVNVQDRPGLSQPHRSPSGDDTHMGATVPIINSRDSAPILLVNLEKDKITASPGQQINVRSQPLIQSTTPVLQSVLSKPSNQPMNWKPSILTPPKVSVAPSTSQSQTKETLADKYIKDWKPTGRYQCRLCFYSCVTNNFLFRHWLNAHCTLQPYFCSYCQFSATTRDAVTRHQTSLHRCRAKDVVVDAHIEQTVIENFNLIFNSDQSGYVNVSIDPSDVSLCNKLSGQKRTQPIMPRTPPNSNTYVLASTVEPAKTDTKIEPMTMKRLKQVLEGKLDEDPPPKKGKRHLTSSLKINPSLNTMVDVASPNLVTNVQNVAIAPSMKNAISCADVSQQVDPKTQTIGAITMNANRASSTGNIVQAIHLNRMAYSVATPTGQQNLAPNTSTQTASIIIPKSVALPNNFILQPNNKLVYTVPVQTREMMLPSVQGTQNTSGTRVTLLDGGAAVVAPSMETKLVSTATTQSHSVLLSALASPVKNTHSILRAELTATDSRKFNS